MGHFWDEADDFEADDFLDDDLFLDDDEADLIAAPNLPAFEVRPARRGQGGSRPLNTARPLIPVQPDANTGRLNINYPGIFVQTPHPHMARIWASTMGIPLEPRRFEQSPFPGAQRHLQITGAPGQRDPHLWFGARIPEGNFFGDSDADLLEYPQVRRVISAGASGGDTAYRVVGGRLGPARARQAALSGPGVYVRGGLGHVREFAQRAHLRLVRGPERHGQGVYHMHAVAPEGKSVHLWYSRKFPRGNFFVPPSSARRRRSSLIPTF